MESKKPVKKHVYTSLDRMLPGVLFISLVCAQLMHALRDEATVEDSLLTEPPSGSV